ncbi:MAG: prolyl oligopeptidase family serine peptidase [Actinomycetia bacterium]|nr:prolyl oligopeptidase family serine peptidase [Actinomycetes bacterium]
MTKETAVLAPTPWQGIRSARPYFTRPRTDLQGTVTTETTSTGQKFVVYLPPDHGTPDRDHAVLYHLHGAGVRWPWVAKDIHWLAAEHEQAAQRGIIEPMIIVGAYDPSRFSMWSDSTDGSNNRATAVLSDLIPHVETSYHPRTDRASRYIQGFSMGGFGAATLGLKHQDLFAAIIIWDGALHDWRTLNQGRSKIAANQFNDDEHSFQQWSPWTMAEQADLARTPILVVAGLMEDYAQRYTDHLTRLGTDVTLASVDCLHDLRCLAQTHGQQAFEFLANTRA